MSHDAKFFVGQVVAHRMFNYRGVVIDVDAHFMGTEEWYRSVALSRPPRDKPWYRVLVHNAVHETYVAERNLDADSDNRPINHPGVSEHFSGFSDGRYMPNRRGN